MRVTSRVVGLVILVWMCQVCVPQATGVPPLGKIVKKAEENKRNPPKPAERRPVKRRVLVTISKETTYILGPLRPDGYPDYVAALNEHASKGVTVENNAAVLLWQAFGPNEINEKARDRFFKKLGIPPLPEKGDYLVPFHQYARIARETQKPPAEDDQSEKDAEEDDKQFDRALERPWSKQDCPMVAKWLEANEKPLKLVVEATKRPRYYSPLVAPNEYPMVILVMSPMQPFREAAQALKARAMFRLQAGKVEEAWADLLACHRLARLVGQGETLVDALVGIAIDGIACSGDRAVAQYGKLRPEQARKLQADLAQLPPSPKMAEKYNIGERFMYLDAVCTIAREGLGIVMSLDGGGLPNQDSIEATLAKWATNVLVDWDEVLRVGNSFYDRLAQAAGSRPYARRREALKELDREIKKRMVRVRDPEAMAQDILHGKSPRALATERMSGILLGLLAPALSACVVAEDRAATKMQLTQLALGLGGYRTEHGEYPAELAKLVPKYIAELPKDLYSGADFRYKREGKGYVLYSLGPNGTDEGGRSRFMDPPPGEDEEVDPAADDIGFRTPAAK